MVYLQARGQSSEGTVVWTAVGAVKWTVGGTDSGQSKTQQKPDSLKVFPTRQEGDGEKTQDT